MKFTQTAEGIEIDFEAPQGARRCGSCTLCCKLLPVVTLDKRAGHRCAHQRHSKGCAIYLSRPLECEMWSCRWLIDAEGTAGMKRPDRAHYAIDPMLDKARVTVTATGEATEFDVLQIWVDPAHREAVNDPELRAYMFKMAKEHGLPTLLRWTNRLGIVVYPPPLNPDGQWHETASQSSDTFGNFARLPREFRERLAKSD